MLVLTKENHEKTQNNEHTGHNLNPGPQICPNAKTYGNTPLKQIHM